MNTLKRPEDRIPKPVARGERAGYAGAAGHAIQRPGQEKAAGVTNSDAMKASGRAVRRTPGRRTREGA